MHYRNSIDIVGLPGMEYLVQVIDIDESII